MEKTNFKDWIELNEARYGNYCGPGPKLNKDCSALANGDPLPQPINTLDRICQNHDLRYCNCGSHWSAALIGNSGTSCSREADKIMQKELKGSVAKLAGSEKLIGNLILRYFQHLERDQNRRDQGPGSGPGAPFAFA